MASTPRPSANHKPVAHQARGPLRTSLLFVGALLFLFEEWLWTVFTRFFAWLGRFGVLRWVDARLVRMPPVLALAVLCTPMLMLLPFKVAGLWMIATGRIVSGCALMLAAKVVSTAIIARIFLTCRPQLMRMPWFAQLYGWTAVLRVRIHQWMQQQPAWAEARTFVKRARSFVRVRSNGRLGTLRRWRNLRRTRRADVARAQAADREH